MPMVRKFAVLLTIFLIASFSYAEQRIISLAPNITEILYALGAGEKVAGVTEFCNYPLEAAQKPSVGGYSRPSLEKVLSLNPDYVLGMREGYTKALKEKLDSLGIKNRFFKADNLGEILNMIDEIAGITGTDHSDVIQPILKTFRSKPEETVQGLYLVSTDPVFAVGAGSFINDTMSCAGIRNLLEASGAKYPKTSLESIYRLNPDVIIVPGSASIKEFEDKLGRLKLTSKVIKVDADLYSRASSRIGRACLDLRQRLAE
ncbi:helical backbone metal receptor [Limisalsivibrio acetivorans]|uniref:helical backbone metal receptor n=1 Tax=Limisalsivibrio acetivorans TaxID=1304888 RepID=UPI0003B4C9DD|nr:helical backbone metal receptor [Limisalsivibrio acetivorans]